MLALQADKKASNPMRDIRVSKLVLNCCTGESGDRLQKAAKMSDSRARGEAAAAAARPVPGQLPAQQLGVAGGMGLRGPAFGCMCCPGNTLGCCVTPACTRSAGSPAPCLCLPTRLPPVPPPPLCTCWSS